MQSFTLKYKIILMNLLFLFYFVVSFIDEFLLDNKKNELNNILCNIKMDLTKLSKTELLVKCEENGIKKCKSKNKEKLIALLENKCLEKRLM